MSLYEQRHFRQLLIFFYKSATYAFSVGGKSAGMLVAITICDERNVKDTFNQLPYQHYEHHPLSKS